MSRKIPEGFHNGIFQLLDLIGGYHSEEREVSEEDFQILFEQNRHIWASLGYSDFIPQPKCDLIVEEDISGEWIEPDFFAYNELNNRWEIVDLKMPKKNLTLKDRSRRKRFSSEIEDYISQMQEYSDYFNERDHREHVNEKHDVDIPPNPPAVLIMGSYFDQSSVDKRLKKYSHDLSVISYDTIVDLLKKNYIEKTGETEQLPGFTIATRLALMEIPTKEREYLYDFGKSMESDRICVFLTNDGDLCMEVIPSSGHTLSVSVPWREVFDIGEQITLYLEFATTDEMSFARLFAGAEFIDEMLITSQTPFSSLTDDGEFEGIGDDFNLYISSNQEGNNGAVFAMFEKMIYSEVKSLEGRLEVMNYLDDRAESDNSGIFFQEGEYALTKDSSDLSKKDESEEFRWVDGQEWIDDYLDKDE